MRTRITESIRCITTKWFLALLVALLCSEVASAQAPTTIFQLDGNSANSNLTCAYGTPCDYWNLINLSGSSGSGRGHSSVNTFILGTSSTLNFTTGGSKDANPISSWAYTSTSTPNKDTLNAGYAAAYSITDFDVVFGADRLSPNGDANIGIWFFQNVISTNGAGGFNGSHANGDVFVISAFTGGGGTSSISVFSWNQPGLPNAINGGCPAGVKNPTPGQCADSNLLLLASPSTVCGSSPYCAITNSATVNASWASYSGNQLGSPLFFEGGVDITAAFAAVGGTVPCFASFLEETRSSQSTTAVLKDFLLGGFPVCSITVNKSCGVSSVDSSGTFIRYPVGGTATNTGVGTLFNVDVTDVVTYVSNSTNNTGSPLTLSVTNSITGSPHFGTNTLGPRETGSWGTTLTSSASSVSDVATSHGTTTATDGVVVDSSPTNLITCSNSPVSMLQVTKMCHTTLVASGFDVQVQVGYNGTVCNTGPSQITGLTLADFTGSAERPQSGGSGPTPLTTTLAPSGCTTYTGSYTPTTIDATASAGRFFFDDQVVISGANATVGALTKVTSSDPVCNNTFGCSGLVSCPICDRGQCVQ